MNKINKLMVVIDGSSESLTASLYGIYLSKLLSAELYVVYVINEKALNELLKARIFIEEEKIDYEKEMEQDADKYLHQVETKASAKGVTIKKIIKKGIVHNEVVTLSKENQIDLILLGQLRKIISVREASYDEMERIMREAPSHVIIVKNDKKVEMLYENL
ncbi:MAG: universal stress protein [Spirochaetes bacterium]|nr:universal stress protein [Spirochaetota bacterium]